jgi:hypothetical protein
MTNVINADCASRSQTGRASPHDGTGKTRWARRDGVKLDLPPLVGEMPSISRRDAVEPRSGETGKPGTQCREAEIRNASPEGTAQIVATQTGARASAQGQPR